MKKPKPENPAPEKKEEVKPVVKKPEVKKPEAKPEVKKPEKKPEVNYFSFFIIPNFICTIFWKFKSILTLFLWQFQI